MLYIATSFHRYLTLHTWIHKLFSLRYLYLFCLFCKEYLQNLRNDPVRSRICKQRVLCRTLAGNFVYILTVTNPSRRPADAEVCKITVFKITRHNVFCVRQIMKNYNHNIIGDEVILDFGTKISALINNLTSEITELPWKPSVRLSAKMATKFQNVMNEDVRL